MVNRIMPVYCEGVQAVYSSDCPLGDMWLYELFYLFNVSVKS